MALRTFASGTVLSIMLSAMVGSNTPPKIETLLDSPDQVPFQSGERLSYIVNWKPLFFIPALKAGELSLELRESTYAQKETYTINAWAVSSGALPRIAGIEVQNFFESIIDRQNFRSYRILKKIREGERRREVEVRFDYGLNQTHLREADWSQDPPRELRNETISGIPGPLSDVLSVFYVARLKELQEGRQYLVYLSDNGKHQEVRASVERQEKIGTPIGNFPTARVSTVGGLFRGGGDFRIWYSQDNLRLPVKFEADAKFGKVYGHIIKFETKNMSRGRISSK
ncbi:MAG: DUF3108 domain-containing protein [Acidobacteria bacterium]|nr:DUF3108 domain-containing protein [Acidobacteriota bacterium]